MGSLRQCFAAALLAFTALAFGGPAAADTAPDSATIREKIRAASGPVPNAFRETDETVSSNGSTVVEHDFRRGKDYRYTFDEGRFHTERGVIKGERWHMNDNGQVILDQPDPGLATGEQTTTTVLAVHTPVEGYAIQTFNVHHHGVTDYVEAATWRVVRRETTSDNGTVVATYDDFRPDGGRTFAHHIHVDNGAARTTSDMRVTQYAPGDVDETEIAMPRSRRALVAFPPGVSSVELPSTFTSSHVVVRVQVGGRGLDFLLDSGASGITIDSAVARELRLPEYDKRSAVTAQRYSTARTIVPEMRVGPLAMKDVAVQEVPEGWDERASVKAVGLLGFDFIAELGLTIDYEHHRVTAVPASAYVPPSDPHTIPLDVRIGGGQPQATAAINGAVGERWVVDTGGAGTFMIFDYFARRHPEALKDLGAGDQRNIRFYGVGGDIDARPYQIASLRFANINFQNFVGYRVVGAGSYQESADGLIGTDFLHLFTLGFDYANSRLYLVPNETGRKVMGIR